MSDYEADIDKLYQNDSLFADSVMLAAHNAFASIEDGWITHPMQQYDFIHQFYYGARGFMIDVYEDNQQLVLLHNKNLKNAAGIGSSSTKTFYFEDFLRGIKNLLERHHDSIITLIIENRDVSQNEIKSSILNTKLDSYLVMKDPNEITFGEMRNTNQRLVVFAENGYKTEDGIYSSKYYKETTYSLEKDKLCIDREEGRAPFSDSKVNILVMNHFYTKSCASTIDTSLGITSVVNMVKKNCNDANEYGEIIKRANLCIDSVKKPTFIAVDFIEQGNNGGALKAVSDLVDESFYKEHLQYSIQKPQYRFKMDISFAAGATIGAGVGFGVGFGVAWLRHHRAAPHVHQQ